MCFLSFFFLLYTFWTIKNKMEANQLCNGSWRAQYFIKETTENLKQEEERNISLQIIPQIDLVTAKTQTLLSCLNIYLFVCLFVAWSRANSFLSQRVGRPSFPQWPKQTNSVVHHIYRRSEGDIFKGSDNILSIYRILRCAQ